MTRHPLSAGKIKNQLCYCLLQNVFGQNGIKQCGWKKRGEGQKFDSFGTTCLLPMERAWARLGWSTLNIFFWLSTFFFFFWDISLSLNLEVSTDYKLLDWNLWSERKTWLLSCMNWVLPNIVITCSTKFEIRSAMRLMKYQEKYTDLLWNLTGLCTWSGLCKCRIFRL